MDGLLYGSGISATSCIYGDDKLGGTMEKLKSLWGDIKSIWTDLRKSQKIFVIALIVIIVIAIMN